MSIRHQSTEKHPGSPRQSPLGASLARWAAQSMYDVNRRAIVWTAITMLLMIFASRRDPGQVAFVRNVAMMFIGLHGVLHVILLNVLGRLRDKGVTEAAEALRCYLAPRRITNLDLAIAWAALTAMVSVYRMLFPIFAAPAS